MVNTENIDDIDFDNYIYDKFNRFSITENHIEKERLRNEIKSELNSQDELNSKGNYILGLVDYNYDDWKEYRKSIIENFKTALKKDKSNFLAQLYLAHIYQDLEELELALENYLKVDTVNLKVFKYGGMLN